MDAKPSSINHRDGVSTTNTTSSITMTTVTSASSSSSFTSFVFPSLLSRRTRRRHGGGKVEGTRNGRSQSSSRRHSRVVGLFIVVVVVVGVVTVGRRSVVVLLKNFHFGNKNSKNNHYSPYHDKILPRTLYVVYGLESSGTTLMVDTLTKALQLPVQLRQGHDTVESLSRGIHIQHLSLPMGVDGVDDSLEENEKWEEDEGDRGSSKLDLPIIDVYLPKRCHVYQDESRNSNTIAGSSEESSTRTRRRKASASTATRTLTTLPVSDLCRPLLHQTTNTKATGNGRSEDATAVVASSPAKFSRYFVNITSHIQWYRDRGVVVYPILVVRDPLYRIRSVLKNHLLASSSGSGMGSSGKKMGGKNNKKKQIQKSIRQYETGQQIIQQSIKQFSQYSQQQQNELKEQPGLVIVSYESLMTIGPTYLTHMIYPQLGIFNKETHDDYLDGKPDGHDDDHRHDPTKPPPPTATTTIYTPILKNGNLKYATEDAASHHSNMKQDEDLSIQDIIDYLLRLELQQQQQQQQQQHYS